MIRPRMSGARMGGRGSERSSNAIVNRIPGFMSWGRGSASTGFIRASRMAASRFLIRGSESGG